MEAKIKHILLVEDETIIAMTESLILEKSGYRVTSVISGEEAVDSALGDTVFDLVLMDINLGPGIDGTEAAERILEVRDIPIVFLSSHTEAEVVKKTEGISSYGYIVKNSGETVLLASIRMAFRLFESRERERRSASEHLHMQSVLKSLAERGYAAGDTIFRFIARELAQALGTRYALIARIDADDPDRAHTLAVWNGSAYEENFIYDLEATPCSNVAAQGTCLYPREVLYRFPEDALLRDLEAESYWGTPLRGYGGEVLGILAVLDTRPMEERPWFLSLLESFAIRAAGELSRLRSERLLEEKQNHLAATLSSIGDAVISTDTEGRVIDLNGLAETLTGWKKSEALGLPSRDVFRIRLPGRPEEAEDPVADVIRTREVAGLQDGAVLLARDNTERLVADSCAPILDKDNRMLGAVLVFRDVSEVYRKEKQFADLSGMLTERVKELRCLYGIGSLINNDVLSFHDMFTESLRLILPALQYPEIACAQITIGEYEFASGSFRKTPWMLSGDLRSGGLKVGSLSVGYIESPEGGGEWDFLPEEKQLFETILGQLSFFMDRKNALAALQQSEERYRSIFDQGVNGICLVDIKSGIITDCNKAFADLLGRDPLELIGKPQKSLHPSSGNGKKFSPEFLEHLHDRQGATLESRIIRADESLIDVEIQASPVYYHGRDVMQGIFRDITEKKAVERELAFQSHLLDSIGQAVLVTDPDGIIHYGNKGVKSFFGWDTEELVGKNCAEVLSVDGMASYSEEIMEKLKAGEVWTGEFRIRRRDGSFFDAIVSDTPVWDDEGKLSAIIGVTTDITEQKEAERRIAALLKGHP
jgi:PAS domain S-box-containing protein